MTLKKVLQGFGIIAIVLTLMPFIAIDYWWIRVFDFPHFQLTVLTLLALVFYFIRFDIRKKSDYLFVIALLLCFLFQLSKIYPYTPLAAYEVLDATAESKEKSISLFVANVLQDNKEKNPLIQVVDKYDSDILLFTETDQNWLDHISPHVRKAHKYKVEVPLSNTYGMLLYSRLPMINPSVQYLVDDSIPSIHTLLQLATGDTIMVIAIHPTPPMPQHNPSSTDRDAEMMKVALKAMTSEYPVMIIGDFNDVAWSESTKNFQIVGGLLDPRKGRGFFNTYHAKYFILRWPLDHIFVSEHFRIKQLQRCESINSDHFPMYAELSFEPEGAEIQKPIPPSLEDIERAQEQIKAEKEEEK